MRWIEIGLFIATSAIFDAALDGTSWWQWYLAGAELIVLLIIRDKLLNTKDKQNPKYKIYKWGQILLIIAIVCTLIYRD